MQKHLPVDKKILNFYRPEREIMETLLIGMQA
jgi:hypothetical protein